MVLVCLPSDAILQNLPLVFLGFSYLGHGISLHGCSSKLQPLLLTLDEGYLLMAAPPDLERGVAPLGPPAPAQQPLLGGGLLKLNSIESVMPSNDLILCHPPLLLPSIFASIRVFSDESVLHIRWPKCWSFSLSICLSNEYSGLISFRMHWLDLLAVQGTLKSLLQHHNSKASIFQHFSFLYSPTFTSIHEYWRNHSFDQMDLFWQSNVSAF